jgi:hypothetical protein
MDLESLSFTSGSDTDQATVYSQRQTDQRQKCPPSSLWSTPTQRSRYWMILKLCKVVLIRSLILNLSQCFQVFNSKRGHMSSQRSPVLRKVTADDTAAPAFHCPALPLRGPRALNTDGLKHWLKGSELIHKTKWAGAPEVPQLIKLTLQKNRAVSLWSLHVSSWSNGCQTSTLQFLSRGLWHKHLGGFGRHTWTRHIEMTVKTNAQFGEKVHPTDHWDVTFVRHFISETIFKFGI